MHAIRSPAFRISEIPTLETESKFHLRFISAEIVFFQHKHEWFETQQKHGRGWKLYNAELDYVCK